MRALTEYVLSSRKKAIFAALLFTVLPFISWIGIVIITLVTLRKGAKEGLLVLLWAALPSVVMSMLGYPQFFYYNVVIGSLIAWLLAVVLQQYRSWTLLIEFATLLAVIVICVVHLFVNDLQHWWMVHLTNVIQNVKPLLKVPISSNDIKVLTTLGAMFATGIQSLYVLISAFGNVLLARWAQAKLFNPGGLSRELLTIRLSWVATILISLMIALAYFGNAVAVDALPVILLPAFLAGLSLVHHVAKQSKQSKILLFSFYVLLIVLFRFVLIALVLLALSDAFLNVRGRFFATECEV